MKPRQPLPTAPPFLTIVTATHHRPMALAANLRSVARQTAVQAIEHLVLPDHVGYGPSHAVYGRLPHYLDAIHGAYVHVLGDDDTLASETVVATLKKFIEKHQQPAAVIVRAQKGRTAFPKCALAAVPAEGDIDLVCYVIRRDVFAARIAAYADHYRCDYDFSRELRAAAEVVPLDLLFATGAEGTGRPEAVDW